MHEPIEGKLTTDQTALGQAHEQHILQEEIIDPAIINAGTGNSP